MERPLHAHRALTAGLSVGAGLAVSAAIYAATIPFEEVHAMVEGAVVPFAVGSVAGVGIYAIGASIADARVRARLQREQDAGDAKADEKAGVKEKGSLFSHSRNATPKGVPVIARAQNALTEAEAWADIDSLLDGSSPVSCDPARSKDIYEIALEEMARTASASTASPSASGAPVPPDMTATSAFVLSQMQAAMATQAQAVVPPVPVRATSDVSAVSVARQVSEVPAVEPQQVAKSQAELASAPASAVQQTEITSVLPELTQDDFLASASAAEEEPAVVEVPVADYSGHEDMWAEALAILEEKPEPIEQKPPRGAHFRKIENTDPVNPLRMSAVAEGANETVRHTRINEILEEELEKVPSQSMRSTSREYLRVIQGGTMSMPRLSAEA
ncbi:hypothetical protein H6A35_09440 [Collinsella tanakaei]|nr:hypothetical protein [Collinsella tanakaei]